MAHKHMDTSLIDHRTRDRLLEEIEELRRQLDEAEQTLQAIRTGDVDALVINGPQGEQIFSLDGAEHQYRAIVETMNEAALTVNTAGTILFCNRPFCELTKTPMETVVGQEFIFFVASYQRADVKEQLARAEARPVLRLTLLASDGTQVSTQLCASPLESPQGYSICLVVSDLSELEASVRSVRVLREQQEALERAQGELARRNAELGRTAQALQCTSERLNLVAQTAELLLCSDSPQKVVNELCRKVMAFLDCQLFINYLVEPTAGRLRLNACAGIPEEEQRRIEWLDMGSAICGCAAVEGMRIVAERISETKDPRVDLVRRYGIEAYGCYPLFAQDKMLGTLSFGTRTRASFSEEDLALMKVVADQVAIAMQRKLGEEALRRSEERLRISAEQLEQLVAERTEELTLSQARLRALASELNLAEQRERKRLATELHDHLQQMLVFGKLTIGQAKCHVVAVPAAADAMKKVDTVLSDALAYSRTLVAELSPPVLRDHGLAAALKWLAEYMEQKHEQSVTVVVQEDDGFKFPEDQQVLLFQSVRELLINASKHAGTCKATVRMTQREDQIQIEVRDEGKGFDLAAAAAAGTPSGGISSKFGLYSIQERMRALGGSFDIQSVPGQGTIATLVLPLVRRVELTAPSPELSQREYVALSIQHSELQKKAVTRVLLADDHAMVRQGLRSVLDAYEDIQVVGEACDGGEALRLVEELQPLVVVMDINMPKMNGIEATTRIRAHWPDITVVGISVNAGDENSDVMKRAGAATVLPKDTAVEQLHAAIVQMADARDRRSPT